VIEEKEVKTEFVLRIISFDLKGEVTGNHAHRLRPEHWKTDIDGLAPMLVGFTNEMKLQLKDEGFTMRQHDHGTVEYVLQESGS
jgi:hypothetical protein